MRLPTSLLLVLPVLAGCPGGHDHDHDHGADGHEHGEDGHEHGEDGGHVHTAPHGGTLLELAEEFAHLELVLDRATGELTAYSLGAHAERPVRLAHEALTVHVDGAESFSVELAAVENPLTGESVGDTSCYRGTDERLATDVALTGRVAAIETKGQSFADVAFTMEP